MALGGHFRCLSPYLSPMQHHCEQYSSPYMDSFGGRPDAAIFEVRLLRQNVIMIVASSQRAMSGATRGGGGPGRMCEIFSAGSIPYWSTGLCTYHPYRENKAYL